MPDLQDLPTATPWETLGVVADVVLPTLAQGVILRRPRMVALAERLALDRRAVRRLQRLRERYGAGPLLLRLPGRLQAVLLAPEHVHRVLDGTPEPFAAASSEKRAALSHFQPHGVLVSEGAARTERRRYNEAVLDSDRPRHLDRAEPGSLASVMAATPSTVGTEPAGQVPQWLFAFDAAGIATFRALALLAAHPGHAARARAEVEGAAPTLPYLRACVLESVRLWPTTPMILRQTTAPTTWDGGAMPAGTGVLIFAPFFHRDGARLPFADRFTPELWLDGVPEREWGLVPFSDGGAACPGRQLVLLLTSTTLATLLGGGTPRLEPPGRLDARRPMPGTLDNYTLRFSFGA